jgi:DNA gyrase subunit A
MMALQEFDADRYLVFATKRGTVKRTRLAAFDSPRTVLIAIDLRLDDELIGVAVTDGSRDLMLVSRGGLAIRFQEADVRAMGRTAGGVRGMRLDAGDEVLAMAAVPNEEEDQDRYLLVVTQRGYGKRTLLEQFTVQHRGGRGRIAARLTEARGQLAGALVVPYEAEVLLVTDTGTLIRMGLVDVRPMGRDTQGVSLMRPGEHASVIGVAMVLEDEVDDPAPMSDPEVAGPTTTGPSTSGLTSDPDASDPISDEGQ